jgi:site-specific recombinase XerC
MRPRSNPLAAHLTPKAEGLLGLVLNRNDRSILVGFLGHSCSRKRPLDELNEADLAVYEAALANLKVGRPKQGARDAAHAWNRMVGRNGWPTQTITPRDNARHAVIGFTNLPAALQADVTAYLNHQSGDDVFDANNAYPLAPATLRDRRGKICQLVSIAVAGGVPLASLGSLTDLTKEATARLILQALWERSQGAKNAHAANLARLLRLIADKHVRAPQTVIEMIGKAESKFRPGKIGMTERNKRKLRHIIDAPKTLRRLLQLPGAVVASLDPRHPTLADALTVQSCLAIQIELVAPMRAKNLAGLDFRQHLDFVAPGLCHVMIEAADVKNDRALEYVLGPAVVQMLNLYRDVYWPLLAGKSKTSPVFISRNGRRKPPDALGAQITKFIREHAGFSMNIHLFRHLAGYLFLKAHPGEYEPVRQLLGHKSIKTTVEFYVGLEQEHSFKRYEAVLDSYSAQGGNHVVG